MANITVKGNSIYYIKRYIIDKYGNDYFMKLIENIEPGTRDILSGALISSNDYALKTKDLLLAAFLQSTNSETVFRDCSAQEVREQIQGLVRIVMKFVSLDMLTKRLQLLWNQHFSGGVITGTRTSENTFLLHIGGIEASKAFWIHIEQYIKGLYEAVGKTRFTSSHRQVSSTEIELIYIKSSKSS